MDGHTSGPPQGTGGQNPAYRPTHRHPPRRTADELLLIRPAGGQVDDVLALAHGFLTSEHVLAIWLPRRRSSDAAIDARPTLPTRRTATDTQTVPRGGCRPEAARPRVSRSTRHPDAGVRAGCG
jgi:hypothetical protein